MAVDSRRWFNRSLPQTLQIAIFLLYFSAFFGLINLAGRSLTWESLARIRYGSFGALVALLTGVIAGVLGGFLIANERKLGYILALVAAVAPFAVRLWVYQGTPVSFFDRLTGGSNNLITLLFEIALIALLVHPQSRNYQKVWFK
jgi:hypothetical protein